MSLLIVFAISVTDFDRFLVRDALRANLGNYTWLDHSAQKQDSQSVDQACHVKEPQERSSDPAAKNKWSTLKYIQERDQTKVINVNDVLHLHSGCTRYGRCNNHTSCHEGNAKVNWPDSIFANVGSRAHHFSTLKRGASNRFLRTHRFFDFMQLWHFQISVFFVLRVVRDTVRAPVLVIAYAHLRRCISRYDKLTSIAVFSNVLSTRQTFDVW